LTSSVVVEKKPELELKAKQASIKSYWLAIGELRLDASFYAEDSRRATRILSESGYKIITIENLSKCVFNPPPIKRQYSGTEGTPYLMPTVMFFLRREPTKFVFASKMKNIEEWFVKEGWLILTQSGKTGIPLYVTKSLERFVISQNAIRIVPKDDTYSGFLYAYLSTWLGQALATRDQFGVTVEHIRPHHVKSIKIPLLPEDIQAVIHNNVLKVFAMREKARILLKKSHEELQKELDLSDIGRLNSKEWFSVKSVNLELRFDATYHAPLVKEIKARLKECKYKVERLEHNAKRIFLPNRFKRIYVKGKYGVPFLTGANIVQIRPRDLKYLSKRVTSRLEDCLVREGWVLITRSGTIGRVVHVPSYWEGWAITEDVIRVIPIPNKLHRGFLTSFLQTKYGYQQILSKIYGGVVDHLAEDDVKDILVPIPPVDVQEKIGNLVLEAYESKELANKIEDGIIETLEDMLTKHKKIKDAEAYNKELGAYIETFDLIGNEEFQRSREELGLEDTTPFDEFRKEHGF